MAIIFTSYLLNPFSENQSTHAFLVSFLIWSILHNIWYDDQRVGTIHPFIHLIASSPVAWSLSIKTLSSLRASLPGGTGWPGRSRVSLEVDKKHTNGNLQKKQWKGGLKSYWIQKDMATFEISIFKIQISKYPFLESPRIIQIRFVKSTGEKWFKVFLSRHRQAMAGPLAALFLQHYHQTLQVPKMEVFADLSCICKAYVEKTHTQNSLIRLSTSIFWYPKLLVTLPLLKLWCWKSIWNNVRFGHCCK